MTKVYKTKEKVFDGKKACTKCGEVKLVEMFGKNDRAKSGLLSWCKSCVAERNRANYSKDTDGRKKYYRKKREQWNEKILVDHGTKVCRRCGEEKPIDHYCKALGNRDDRTNFCRACRVVESREYKHKKGIHKPFVPTVVDGQKVCTKCNERKSVAEFNKQQGSSQPQSWCKVCKRDYVREYQIARGLHKGGRRVLAPKIPKQPKPPGLWQTDIIAAVTEHARKGRDSNPKWLKQWRKENPINCYPKPDRRKRRSYLQAEYKRRNPGAYRDTKRNCKLKRRGAQGSHTENEWQDLLAKHDHKCISCGDNKDLTRDHIIPISKGGTNFIENIQPLCRSCNSRKSNKI